ncbi:agamous-like MADS-box protein AGL29 [Miscanthus floridulus]|uniref:agamous-like MADS-box protein AGL29 n=1 Tax=Miscanthus floridulus TaxID=154761 RepID=UPI0034593D30
MGRQKIEMKRIESKEARQVCFSKRHQGLFKKASDLSILCGAMVAIVAFSPTGRPFSFGSPSFRVVIDSFLTLISPATSDESCDASSREANIKHQMSLECSELGQMIEVEKERKERLKEMIECHMDSRTMPLLTTNAYPSVLDELQEFHKKLQTIQDVIKEKIKKVLQEQLPTRPYPLTFMDLASRYQLDEKITTPISSMSLNSIHGLTGGVNVNDSSANGIHAIGTSVSCAIDQLDG